MIYTAKITCPHCGFSKEETMPATHSDDSYPCTKCGQVLKTREEDCCVYCSYSNTICPPQQEKRNCCSG